MNEPFWYWLLFGLAIVFVAAPYLLFRWEDRQARRDKELWEAMHR